MHTRQYIVYNIASTVNILRCHCASSCFSNTNYNTKTMKEGCLWRKSYRRVVCTLRKQFYILAGYIFQDTFYYVLAFINKNIHYWITLSRIHLYRYYWVKTDVVNVVFLLQVSRTLTNEWRHLFVLTQVIGLLPLDFLVSFRLSDYTLTSIRLHN